MEMYIHLFRLYFRWKKSKRETYSCRSSLARFQYVNGRLSEQVDYKKGKINGGYFFLPNDTDFELDGSRVFKFTRKGYTFPQDVSALRLSFQYLTF